MELKTKAHPQKLFKCRTGNGQIGHCNQGNNMYLFPGVGLGTLLSGSSIVSDGMLQNFPLLLYNGRKLLQPLIWVAYMSEEDVINGKIYPSISSIRDITEQVAAAVVKEAIEEDLAEGYREMDARELKRLNKEEIKEYVQNNMWSPEYPTLISIQEGMTLSCHETKRKLNTAMGYGNKQFIYQTTIIE
ncbi:hypothetical protein Ddye_022532 [Dipteronia dyeriana]|uniref:Malic enzyme NAD-binding domain-containing protein n=1 Tax=Dipteronia dyeriana TaxID=168575 RepID=A0AAD9WRA7_9ROSI|nr:hypothetical protein Ddye_022532 [Dipteronia dyeriana]